MKVEKRISRLTPSEKYDLDKNIVCFDSEASIWELEDMINAVIWIKSKDGFLDVYACSVTGKSSFFKKVAYTPFTFTKTHKKSFLELCYVEKGCLKKSVSGEIHSFDPGEICITNGQNLSCEYMDQSDAVFCFLMISPRFFEKTFFFESADLQSQKFIKDTILNNTKKYKVIRFTPKTQNNEVQHLFEKIIDELFKHETGYSSIITGYVERILDLLCFEYRISLTKDELTEYTNKLFLDIDNYMKANYSAITEKSLSEYFYYAPEYLNRLIKKHTGLSYSKYLQKIRLEHSVTLLTESQLPIEEIARSVGYTNLSFFYKLFRQKYGSTPNSFRQKHLIKK